MQAFDSDMKGHRGFIDLSQNEARVLHSLIKYADKSDQIIHQSINMKKSTFSSIKTRLSEQGYYRKYYIPNFPKIGFELLLVMFGELNRFSSYEERIRVAGDTVRSFDEDFHVVSGDNKAFNLSISINYTDYIKNIQRFLELYQLNNFLSKKGMNFAVYPFEISRIHSFMDYESLIAKLFGFSSETYDTRRIFEPKKVSKVKLTRAERKVLAGLIKYPEESDTLIAKNIAVSRNTVANAKRKFLSKRICFPRVVPNLEKLGLKVLNFTYRKFNSTMKESDRILGIEKVRTLFTPHFFISSDLDGFFISAHRSMDEYRAANDELMEFYEKSEYLLDEPISYQMNIETVHKIKEFDFLPMILKFFDFDSEFNFRDK